MVKIRKVTIEDALTWIGFGILLLFFLRIVGAF